MYFLGIDPGLSEVGFGIVEVLDGDPVFVDAGIIKTKPDRSFPERLDIIKKDLTEIMEMHRYEAVGIEELFFVKNVTNGIKVAHSRGVIVQTAYEHGIPIMDFKPTEIKMQITGSGAADKKQMQEMVKRLLNLNDVPKPHDAADALGIAILTGRLFEHQLV